MLEVRYGCEICSARELDSVCVLDIENSGEHRVRVQRCGFTCRDAFIIVGQIHRDDRFRDYEPITPMRVRSLLSGDANHTKVRASLDTKYGDASFY